MNVYPRQALEANWIEEVREWSFDLKPQDTEWGSGCIFMTDAEFTAAFVPAERLDALIEAAAMLDNALLHLADEEADHACPRDGCWSWEKAHENYVAARRAYDEGQEQ